ncbi:MAG: tetratricopeptide repeat protein [Chloroflexota bacterium]|nr:tetratricopeptide repeat protein [Chloroflexota bacterium]
MGILDRFRQKGEHGPPANEARSHLQKGEEAYQKNNYGKAEREFKKVIELDPNSSDARERLEDTYMMLAVEKRWEDTDKLIRLLNECVRLSPKKTLAHALLGRIYDLQGRLEEANREYREHLRLWPGWGNTPGLGGEVEDEMLRGMLGIPRRALWEEAVCPTFRSWSEVRGSLGG